MGFAHLHLHTEYSLLDGACRIPQVLDRAVELGQQHVAITDHGVMYGAVEFYEEAKKRGINPVIGCEVYVARRTRTDRVHEYDREPYHLVLLCENNQGYQNLIKLVSEAWVTGFYGKPRVDMELLEQYHEGLICLSACLAGAVPRALMAGDYDEARETALRYQSIFGENNYFLEVQDHGIPEQKRILPMLKQLSRETGIPLVATNDCHYIRKEDHEMHKVLLCIQTNHTIDEEGALEFPTEEFYLKSEEEMRSLFSEIPEACDNTVRIAQRCSVTFEFGETKLPRFETPDGTPNEEYFRGLCENGLRNRYGPEPEPALWERLRYEMDTISRMGYVNYYLIVHDFIRHAKSVDLPVGPGRGSGAGSLAAYSMGITDIDPIRYDLLFERFLNPERVSMPDFDIDFSDERRGEMIDYVIRKYGSDHVAQIVTFGTMAAKAAIRDVGRVFAMPYSAVDQIAKLVPNKLNITLAQALELSRDLRDRYEQDDQVRRLIDMARKVEGMPRNTSTHAAGVVITDQPVDAYVPLAMNSDAVVTQYTMTTLERLGLLKMDFLGLRNLSVIDNTEKMIRSQKPGFSVERVPVDDPAVYRMLSRGETEGVFQFESAGMKSVIMRLRPVGMEDLIAVISLYRPGPMDSIPKYIENRHHPEKVTYAHPLLEPILNVTYGCIVYQEQVMSIFRSLAGYSLGRADLVRRAMSKKKADVMEAERRIFIYGMTDENGQVLVDGCIRRGVPEETAKQIFHEMESFAAYAFNKSHAAAYAAVSYRTAWLKCHYPKEYLAALLTSVLDFKGKMVSYINDCSRMGIGVLPPHVNESGSGFTISGDHIRFGLLAIKNLGRGFIDRILQERERGGTFPSFYQFVKRMFGTEMNRRALESLIKCGALDGLSEHYNRKQMLLSAGEILSHLEADRKKNVEGQIGFFDLEGPGKENMEYQIQPMSDYSISERLQMEREVAGMYLSGHPMAEYRKLYDSGKVMLIADMQEDEEGHARYGDNDEVRLLGIVTELKRKVTKTNSVMAFMTMEDISAMVEVLIFPKIFERISQQLQEGSAVLVRGRVSTTEGKDAKLLCDSIEPVHSPEQAEDLLRSGGHSAAGQTASPASGRHPGLYLRVPAREDPKCRKALQYTAVFDGRTPLYLYSENEHKLVRLASDQWVDVNDVLLRVLKELLGSGNVALVAENQAPVDGD